MSDEGTPIVGEAVTGSLSAESYNEAVEQKAREKGWRPLEEWEGPADDWVDSKEFVGRQKLYDRISELKGTLTKQQKEFQSDMKSVVANLAKVRETEYKKAVASLKAKQAQAIEDDDARTAVKVSEELKDLEAERAAEAAQTQQASQTTGAPTPEFIAWEAENQWFNTDQEMRADAINYGVGYAAGNPNKTQAEVLAHVTAKIKRIYPEKFEKKEKRQVASPVEGNSPSAKQTELNTRKGKLSFGDLPEAHQKIAAVLIKNGALKAAAEKNKRSQQDEYLAQYQENM